VEVHVYCPQCLVEYREGFTQCSDCGVPLLEGTPPEPDPHFDPSLDLVVVLETNDRFQAALAKGTLEDAGIPFFVLGQITTLVNDVDGFLRKWVRIQVPRDREAEARELLEEVMQPVADAETPGEEPVAEN
jgi:Putative prokaryotic signal transducing protein